MFDNNFNTIAYTPEQVAKMLQLNKNTVYSLIAKGEIIAKKVGKVFRIPAASLAFVFGGLDFDLFKADKIDQKLQPKISSALKKARADL